MISLGMVAFPLAAVDAMRAVANRHNGAISVDDRVYIERGLQLVIDFGSQCLAQALTALMRQVHYAGAALVVLVRAKAHQQGQYVLGDAALLKAADCMMGHGRAGHGGLDALGHGVAIVRVVLAHYAS